LTRSKAAVWTVDDVARMIEFKKRILIYLFVFKSRWHVILRDDKIRMITKLYKTLLCLLIYYMNNQNVSSRRLYKRLYNRL